MEWLKGKKTYIVGIGMIVAAFVGLIDERHDMGEAIKLGLEALAFMAVRAGVAKAANGG